MVCCEGEEVLRRLYATEVFEAEGVELVPLIYAVALPNGIMARDAYDFYADRILGILSGHTDVDGVFLHLHGSMEVAGLGSGEYDLIRRIRALLGDRAYIGVALDFHANTDARMPEMVNVIRNYRTVPHSDQDVTEKTVARKLLDCIRSGERTVPQYVRLPYAIHPEKALGATWPLCELFEKLGELERREEIAVASLGCGMIWCDCRTLASNVVVTPSKVEHTAYARKAAEEFAAYVYSLRDSFEFEQLPLSPHEAARYAVEFAHGSPVYVSDSGDNTTAGAAGDRAGMLNLALTEQQRILIAGLTDAPAVEQAYRIGAGGRAEFTLGGTLDHTHADVCQGMFEVVSLGQMLGWYGEDAGRRALLRHGTVDVIVTENRCAVISPEIIRTGGADVFAYDAVVVKLGYLYPALAEIAPRAVFVMTEGASTARVETIRYQNVPLPVYPADPETRYDGVPALLKK